MIVNNVNLIFESKVKVLFLILLIYLVLEVEYLNFNKKKLGFFVF